MHLKYPKTIPSHSSLEKLSSMKLVPGAKTIGDHWYKDTIQSALPG